MKIYHQSVFDKWPIEDNSIQAIITSPPYWGLRKYNIPDITVGGLKDCKHEFNMKNIIRETGQQGAYGRGNSKTTIFKESYQNGFCTYCNSWRGQYGLEKSYKDYIEHTLLWAKEAWRVLKNDGVMFLNIGDSYSSHKDCKQVAQSISAGKPLKIDGMANKCKMLIPHRVAIALIDNGWILRNDIIWYKLNGLPESVRDRFTKRFEYIFMFTKQEKYFFNLDTVREPHQWIDKSGNRISKSKEFDRSTGGGGTSFPGHRGNYTKDGKHINNPLGKNPGDVWSFIMQPSSEKHFAMWPEKLVERMLLCSTKPGDTVLDPFAGSGTTVRVAEQHNRIGYGIDLGYQNVQKSKLDEIQKRLIWQWPL